MERPVIQLVVFAIGLAAAVGCKPSRLPPADASVSSTPGVTVRATDGTPTFSMSPRGSGDWDAVPSGKPALRVRKTPEGVQVRDALGEVVTTLKRFPGGAEIFNADDTLVARMTIQKFELSFTGANGEPLLVVATDGPRAAATAKRAGDEIVLVARTGGDGVYFVTGDGAPAGKAEGTRDAALATVLAVTQLSPEARAAIFAADPQ